MTRREDLKERVRVIQDDKVEADDIPAWQLSTGQWFADRLNSTPQQESRIPQQRIKPSELKALEQVAKRGSRFIYFSRTLEWRFRTEQRQGNRTPRIVLCLLAVLMYGSAPLWAEWVFRLPPEIMTLTTLLSLGFLAPLHLIAGIAQYRWIESELAEALLLFGFCAQIAVLELLRIYASRYGLHLGPMLTVATPISVYAMVSLPLSKRLILFWVYLGILAAGYLLFPDPVTHLSNGEWLGAVLIAMLSLTGSIFFQISVRRGWAANNLLEVSATQDVMTGLPNRLAFVNHLEAHIRNAQRYNKICMLALVDLDHFKKINDRYGHDYGDGVLMEVGLCLQQFARRPGDLAARVGGEEFAVFLYDCNWQGARSRLDDIIDHICDLGIDHEDNVGGIVTASLGAVAFSGDTTLAQAYQAADKLLYQSKAEGRNRVSFEVKLT